MAFEENDYSFIDPNETSPEKRIAQMQRLRMGMLKGKASLDKVEMKLVKDIVDGDLSLMRLVVDKDNNDSQRELAAAIAKSIGCQNGNPFLVEGEKVVEKEAPEIPLDALPPGEVPEWSKGTELGSPEYDEIMGEDK